RDRPRRGEPAVDPDAPAGGDGPPRRARRHPPRADRRRGRPVSTWREELGDRFADENYGSVRGLVRTHTLHQHLLAHLPAPPAALVDVGGGAGHQAVPLAEAGYDVTIVDPSEAML